MSKIWIYLVMVLMASTIFNSNIFVSSGSDTRSKDPGSNENDKIAFPSTPDPDLNDNEKSTRTRLEEFNQGAGNNFFTANYGQVGNDDVKFYLQGQGVWFTTSGVVFELVERSKDRSLPFNKFEMPMRNPEDLKRENEVRKNVVVTFNFVNCNNVLPTGEDELPHKSNFFYGNDSDFWRSNVPNFNEILYENIYNNIDLRYYNNEDGLKYDLIVHPGGKPGDIQIGISSSNESLTISNDLIKIETELGNIFDRDLFVYQRPHETLNEVPARFKMIDSNSYGFKITGVYNDNQDLIIDPFIFSTYIGGMNTDVVMDIEIDDQNNVYATGVTNSPTFPVTGGAYDPTYNLNEDIFVIKLKNDGSSLIYSTFIGGKDNDTSYASALDELSRVYLTGMTTSTDFPTTSNALDTIFNSSISIPTDIIVCRLTADGSGLDYSTFLKGNGGVAYDIVVDDNNSAYITGVADLASSSLPLPYSGFVFMYKIFIDTPGMWGTAFGNYHLYGGFSIALDNNNDIIVTGVANSTEYLCTNDAYDKDAFVNKNRMFITKFKGDTFFMNYSTFFGPISNTWPTKVLVDDDNNIVITGYTLGNDLPITGNALKCPVIDKYKGFIIKFDPVRSELLYSSYFNAGTEEHIYDAVLDKNYLLYVTGMTRSPDLPVTENAYYKSLNGDQDIFLTAIDINRSEIRYSSYFGGNGNETGYSLVIDENKYLYIGGKATEDFTTTNNTVSPNYNGGISDGFILKYGPNFLELEVSKPIVFRGESVFLYSNVSKYVPLEKSQTPHFEYMEPTQQIWKNELLSSQIYNNERWQITFNIPADVNLGYYSFRVRYNDSHGRLTKWLYLNNSLMVLNNPPDINYFNLSKQAVEIGEAFLLFVNGTDYEDEMEDFTFEIEYKHIDAPFWLPLVYAQKKLIDSKWEYNITFNQTHSYGYYDFRAMVYDSDLGISNWRYIYNSLLVTSGTPKVVRINLSKPEIYRTEAVEAYVNCIDPDSEPSELDVELQFKQSKGSVWTDLSVDSLSSHWEAFIKSKVTWALGNYSFRARAMDREENTSPWFYLNDSLNVLNNKPRMLEIGNIHGQMDRGGSISIPIDAKDKENEESELVIELEYKLAEGISWKSEYLSTPDYSDSSWRYEFALPNDAPTGTYNFRARVQDLDNDWSPHLYMNDSLLVTNHAPVVLSFEQTPAEVYRTETVMITADGSDIETLKEELECNIYFKAPKSIEWEKLDINYNTTSNKWFSELITTKSFKLGNYSFKVEFSDADGILSKPVYANRTVWVRNNLPVISDELDNIQVGSTQIIFKLTDLGYDVETSKSDLKWKLDFSTVNTKLFYIDEESTSRQELEIYPVASKQGQDDITLILIDSDNGRVTKTDITIVVDSRVEGDAGPPDEDDPMKKIVEGDLIWLYILVIIIIIILFVLFIVYRRKKKQKEEEMQREKENAEKVLKASKEEALPAAAETVQLPPAEPVSEPAAALEPAPASELVPMPAPGEMPQLPASIAITSPEAIDSPEPEATQMATEPEIGKARPEDERADQISEESESKKN